MHRSHVQHGPWNLFTAGSKSKKRKCMLTASHTFHCGIVETLLLHRSSLHVSNIKDVAQNIRQNEHTAPSDGTRLRRKIL